MNVHDPYYIEPRKALTRKQKLQMFIAADGLCCLCATPINGVFEMWDEHVNPLWLNGDNSAPNRAPAHDKCTRQKTSGEATVRSEIRATAEKHMGAKDTRKRPMDGSKRSRFKKKLDGTVVAR